MSKAAYCQNIHLGLKQVLFSPRCFYRELSNTKGNVKQLASFRAIVAAWMATCLLVAIWAIFIARGPNDFYQPGRRPLLVAVITLAYVIISLVATLLAAVIDFLVDGDATLDKCFCITAAIAVPGLIIIIIKIILEIISPEPLPLLNYLILGAVGWGVLVGMYGLMVVMCSASFTTGLVATLIWGGVLSAGLGGAFRVLENIELYDLHYQAQQIQVSLGDDKIYASNDLWAMAAWEMKRCYTPKHAQLDYGPAIPILKLLIEKCPDTPNGIEAFSALADHYKANNNPEKAISCFNNIIKYSEHLDKSFWVPLALFNIGSIHEEMQKDSSTAQDYYSQVLKQYPNSIQARNIASQNAQAMMRAGKHQEALQLLEQNIAKSRADRLGRLVDYAEALQKLSKYDQALEQLIKAERIAPKSIKVYVIRLQGDVLAQGNRKQAALAAYKRALALANYPPYQNDLETRVVTDCIAKLKKQS